MDDPARFFDLTAKTYDAALTDASAEDESVGWAGEDVPFYRELACTAPGPALEIGVGTGRVYLELLRSGLDVDGIDVSGAMLDRLREKADTRELDPSVWVADATDLDVAREYGLVYCPARAFNHVASLRDQQVVMRSVHDALSPGGTFALNTFVVDPRFVADHYGEVDTRTATVDGETYTVRSVTELVDTVELVARYRKEIRDAAGDVVAESETPLALVPKRQFELLFEQAGFAEWTFYGGFDGDPLESAGQELVAVARR